MVPGALAAAALLGLFLWRCHTHPAPVVELSLLRLRPFAAANAVFLCFFVGFGAMLLSSVLFLTGPWGYGTLAAGLMIAPGPLTVALISVNVKRLTARSGARPVILSGCLFLAAGAGWWAWRLDTVPDYLGAFLPGMLLVGIGVGLTQASLFGFATGILPAHRLSTGSGVLNMSRQIGLALGVAILVALLGSSPAVADFRLGFIEMIAAGLLAAVAATRLPAGGPRQVAP